MKILYIGHEEYLNGASRSLLSIIDHEIKVNEVYVLTSFSSGEFYDELCKRKVKIIVKPFYRWIETKDGFYNWLKLKIKWNLKRKYINERTAKKVASFCVHEKIDIIHTNTSVINIGMLISKYSGVKHVWHIREFGDLDFNMYPLMSKRKFQHQMNYPYTERYICISKAVSKHYNFLDDTRKIVIYNGIDENYSIENNNKIPKDYIFFLVSGRISEAKGQKDVLDAIKLLCKLGINNFIVYFAGTGNFDPNIISKVPPEHYKILGYVSNMVELRKNTDVEIVSSRAEAFGRVTIEAMYASMPVIGSNSGGTPELIRDGKNGFLYAPGNAKELAKWMKFFIDNPEKIYSFGEYAHKFALRNFNMDNCVKRIDEVYKSL